MRFAKWLTAALLVTATATAADDGSKPADMTKPVKVFVMMGQSNMLGFGKVAGGEGSLQNAVKNKGLYPYLIDADGAWAVRNDVRNVRMMTAKGKAKVHKNEWMTIKGPHIGPEIGIGHFVGNAVDAPVLLLKSCIGNRSLAWDLLPPGSERYTVDGVTYAGYKDHPTADILPRPGWKYPGRPVAWYAGKQYDEDIAAAKQALAELDQYYPGATSYEVAGFFWWQGDKDRNPVHAGRYELNLVNLIKTLRKDFNAPEAKFVCATLGQTPKEGGNNPSEKMILDAMFAVSDPAKHPEFKGAVATVYSHPLSKGGSSSGHYSGNAETYMNVGEAMGKAMVELLDAGKGQP